MARLQKELIAKRESYVIEAFRADPKAKVSAVNDSLAKEFGGRRMGLKRIYQLRDCASMVAAKEGTAPVVTAETTTPTTTTVAPAESATTEVTTPAC